MPTLARRLRSAVCELQEVSVGGPVSDALSQATAVRTPNMNRQELPNQLPLPPPPPPPPPLAVENPRVDGVESLKA